MEKAGGRAAGLERGVRKGSLDEARREDPAGLEAIGVGVGVGVGEAPCEMEAAEARRASKLGCACFTAVCFANAPLLDAAAAVGVVEPEGEAPAEMASEMEKALEMENSRCRVPSSPRRSRRASLTSKCDVRSDRGLVLRLRTCGAVGGGRSVWVTGAVPGVALWGLTARFGPSETPGGDSRRLPSPTAHLCGRRARCRKSLVGKRAGHQVAIKLGHEGRGRRGRARLRRVPGPVYPVAWRRHRRQGFRHPFGDGRFGTDQDFRPRLCCLITTPSRRSVS